MDIEIDCFVVGRNIGNDYIVVIERDIEIDQ
jgi:hypothetical protein